MDLKSYICRGFHGDFDRLMRDVPVAGIDRQQTHSMIRLSAETELILYGPLYSPRQVRVRAGSRPKLEAIAATFDRDTKAAMQWTRDHVRHPNFAGVDLAPDRALREEDLIDSGLGWCNEQCRVFIALCELMGFPARLCFLFHANGKTGHTACEVRRRLRWEFHDVTFGITTPMEARQIWSDADHRRTLDYVYAEPLAKYYAGRPVPFDLSRGGDLFTAVGICDYLIEGVEAER